MNYSIDLKELAYRESEQVEWKENVADINDVIQTAVAFANDYSNLGWIYCLWCERSKRRTRLSKNASSRDDFSKVKRS